MKHSLVTSIVCPGVSALLLAGVCAGQQQYVWPKGYANKEGNSSQAAPFSVDNKITPLGSRAITLVSAQTVPFATGRNIVGVAFRRDGGDKSSYGGLSGSYSVRIGPIYDAMKPGAAPRDPWSGPEETVANGQLSLGSQSAPGSGPAPFTIQFPFSSPWPWKGGDFAVEVSFGPGGSTTWNRDAVWVQPRVDGDVTPLGVGCKATTGLDPLAWVDSASAVVGGQIVALVQGVPLPLGSSAILGVGMSSGPQSLAPLMPASCTAWIKPMSSRPAVTSVGSSRFGYAGAALPVPNVPSVAGLSLALQWAVPDRGIGTRVPYVVSNALEVTVGAPAPQAPNYGRSFWGYGVASTATDYAPVAGPPSYVPVIQFSVQ